MSVECQQYLICHSQLLDVVMKVSSHSSVFGHMLRDVVIKVKI
jgi:hypothetical protein